MPRLTVCALALALITAACSFTAEDDEPRAPVWVDAWQVPPTGVVPKRCGEPSALGAFPNARARSQTLRFAIRPAIDGSGLRVRLTNRLSPSPLTIRRVTVAEHAGGTRLVKGTIRDVRFEGRRSITIPPGADAISDDVFTRVDSNRAVAVSVAIASGGPLTWHPEAAGVAHASAPGTGDQSVVVDGTPFRSPLRGYPVLNGLTVRASEPTSAIVALGDSLTDNAALAPANSWVDILGSRLRKAGIHRTVLNAGIVCNRLLTGTEGGGPQAVERLRGDALDRVGVSHVVVFLGANDLQSATRPEPIIAAIRDLAERTRRAGHRVIGATLFPNNAASATQHAVRRSVNEWIRTSDAFDGVIDFDRVIRSARSPNTINPRYNADGLHLNAAGQRAMGNAIRLSLFS